MTERLLVALAAGMVATVNPCGFAMLPAYLSLVVSGSADRTRAQKLVRALASGGLMTLGFVVFFGLFGLLVTPVAAVVQRYLPFVTVLIGLVMVAAGVLLFTGRSVSLPKLSRWAPTDRLSSMFGYGVAFAVASLSCAIGPFLAVAGTAFGGGFPVFLAYAAGMGIVVTALAVAGSAASGVRRVLPYASRIGAALLVVVGAYVAYYGVYELRIFLGDGDPADPVVSAFATVQEALVAGLTAAGPVTVLVVLAGLSAVLLVRRR